MKGTKQGTSTATAAADTGSRTGRERATGPGPRLDRLHFGFRTIVAGCKNEPLDTHHTLQSESELPDAKYVGNEAKKLLLLTGRFRTLAAPYRHWSGRSVAW